MRCVSTRAPRWCLTYAYCGLLRGPCAAKWLTAYTSWPWGVRPSSTHRCFVFHHTLMKATTTYNLFRCGNIASATRAPFGSQRCNALNLQLLKNRMTWMLTLGTLFHRNVSREAQCTVGRTPTWRRVPHLRRSVPGLATNSTAPSVPGHAGSQRRNDASRHDASDPVRLSAVAPGRGDQDNAISHRAIIYNDFGAPMERRARR